MSLLAYSLAYQAALQHPILGVLAGMDTQSVEWHAFVHQLMVNTGHIVTWGGQTPLHPPPEMAQVGTQLGKEHGVHSIGRGCHEP